MNNVNLLGRLVESPELKTTNNTSRVRFTLAVPRKFSKDSATDFVTCVAFGKTAEFAEKYVTKGQRVSVTGHIQTGSYDFQISKNKSKRIYTTDIVVEEIGFADAKKEAVA